MPSWALQTALAVVSSLIVLHLAVRSTRVWVWKVQAGIGAGMLAVLVYFGLVWAPPESFMNDVVRILYVHVPFVWMCMLAFTVNVIAAVMHLLIKPTWESDALAEASAEVGVFFGVCGVLMGSIWAKPTWGVWWNWDPRLISTTVMILVYVGYLAFRSFTEDAKRRATWSAAAAILGYISLPITWFSVKWWNSLHQQQSDASTMSAELRMVYLWGAVTYLAFLFVFLVKRYELARSRQTEALELPPALAPKPLEGQ